MSLLALWMINGSEAPKNVPAGIELVKKAAEKSDGTALFALGKLYLNPDGKLVPADPEKGLKLMQDASIPRKRGCAVLSRREIRVGCRFRSPRANTSVSAPREPSPACPVQTPQQATDSRAGNVNPRSGAGSGVARTGEGRFRERSGCAGRLAAGRKLSAEEINRAEKLKPQQFCQK